MEMSEDLWNSLSQVVNADPDLMQQLRAAKDKETLISLLTKAASRAGISSDEAGLEQCLASSLPFDKATLTENELETVAAAGGAMSDLQRGFLAVVYGTGLGAAILSGAAELMKPGGAKELANAIYNGGEITDKLGHD